MSVLRINQLICGTIKTSLCLQVVQNQHSKPSSNPKEDGGNGEGPGKVVIFSRNAETGALTHTGKTADVPANVSVCVVDLHASYEDAKRAKHA